MARRRKLTNPLALAVLSVLIGGPMHPYEIARVLKHWGKEESIKIRYGSLYTVVQDLEKRGLVEAEGTARAGHRPERTVYRLAPEGRQELEERLRELISEPVKEYPLFASALSLVAVLPPGEVAVLLDERLRTLELEIVATRAMLDELVKVQRLPRVFVLETEYALATKVAEAEWVRGDHHGALRRLTAARSAVAHLAPDREVPRGTGRHGLGPGGPGAVRPDEARESHREVDEPE